MAEMTKWLEGFVYRGRPPWVTEAPAWHVEIGRCVEDDDGGREMLMPLTLTPEQAAAAGFPLPAVLAAIDVAALADRDAALAEAAALRSERDALAAELAARRAAASEPETAASDKAAL
ncbi:hypothetical protein [Methylobacterium nonmethylotrophicum]|uniref:Uncharacterized protein n=1 Tax=Methylobacterium nonmethylotrophicum TaxID=1141884 RepID=A0A4Z0NL52_9HYPH|nr:hypothetical protein [Methylobacterium nonmethylotrophicum]TGD96481.1 hypothetical protein EU555_23805 [Methylobacterium nonmethylotrophicum]